MEIPNHCYKEILALSACEKLVIDPSGKVHETDSALLHYFAMNKKVAMGNWVLFDVIVHEGRKRMKQAIADCLISGSAYVDVPVYVAKDEMRHCRWVFFAEGHGGSGIAVYLFDRGPVISTLPKKPRDTVFDGNYIQNLSSDFRTSMNGIIGMAGLLLSTELTQEQRDYTGIMRDSAESLMRILNNLIDVAKVETGDLRLDDDLFDSRLIIRNIDDAVSGLAEERGLSFHTIIDDDMPLQLIGDAGRFRQAVSTIILKAIQFTPQGNVEVRYALSGRKNDAAFLSVTVTDTGISLDEAQFDQLVASFDNPEIVPSRHFVGGGLELYIAKRLVILMGGTILVNRIDDGGISIEIQVEMQEAQIDHAPIQPTVWSDDSKIMIYDFLSSGEAISKELTGQYNCQCEYQNSADEVMQEMRDALQAQRPFDVAILDMDMESEYRGRLVSGKQLGKMIKCDPVLQRTIIIMLTARGVRGDVRELRQMGFDVYLPKPVDVIQLGQSILLAKSNRHMFETHVPRMITRHTLKEEQKRNVRILIVEDNLVNQKVALKMLEKLGYRADLALDGAECVRMLTDTAYDLVFMDIQMPNLNGFEATRIIRDSHSAVLEHSVPIIAMTAHSMEVDRNKYLNAGMNDYIIKPISMSVLDNVISKWLVDAAANEYFIMNSEQDEILFEGEKLLEQLVGDEETYQQVIQSYLADTMSQIARLKVAIEHNEMTQTRDLARLLGSASDDVTAKALKHTARQIEHAATLKNRTTLSALLEKLEGQFEQTRRWIEV